jgi:5-carboxymethyl-2-hydroxymuconate isomerase
MRKTGAERQAAYRKRMKELGFVHVTFEIPAERSDEFKRLVAEARAKHIAENQSDD